MSRLHSPFCFTDIHVYKEVFSFIFQLHFKILLTNFYILRMILVYILRDSRNDRSIYIARF